MAMCLLLYLFIFDRDLTCYWPFAKKKERKIKLKGPGPRRWLWTQPQHREVTAVRHAGFLAHGGIGPLRRERSGVWCVDEIQPTRPRRYSLVASPAGVSARPGHVRWSGNATARRHQTTESRARRGGVESWRMTKHVQTCLGRRGCKRRTCSWWRPWWCRRCRSRTGPCAEAACTPTSCCYLSRGVSLLGLVRNCR